MGIIHFTTLGTSPGAVTSPLAYLKRHYETYRGDYQGALLESVVMFCSRDVARGEREADDYIWNTYGTRAARQGWQRSRGNQYTIEIIREFLSDARHGVALEGGSLYVWVVDVDDYNSCSEAVAIATVAMALKREDATGKYVWAHLTGGTNVLNAALVQAASSSGLIGRLFYTFLADNTHRKYLNPSSEDKADFRLDEMPVIKMTFDAAYYRILELIAEMGETDASALLERLKADEMVWQQFDKVDEVRFVTQYLNRMDGREIRNLGTEAHLRRDVKRRVGLSLTESGKQILERIKTALFQTLINRGETVPDDLAAQCRAELDKRKVELD